MPASRDSIWLVKSEPFAFSWQDLLASPRKTTTWDGVRNYQARNFLRDGFSLGDLVFFYQSCTKPLAIVGTMRVVREAFADPTQFDAKHDGFDSKSQPSKPRWLAVGLRAETSFCAPVTLSRLRDAPACKEMCLLKKGSRLSVQPVPPNAARWILAAGSAPQTAGS